MLLDLIHSQPARDTARALEWDRAESGDCDARIGRDWFVMVRGGFRTRCYPEV